MSTINNHQCVNCEQLAPENFCPNCGQKQGVERLTWSSVFSELQKRLFGFDNNFLRTVKDLTITPHKVIASSIEGVRVRYIGPVGYYFLMVTIYIIFSSIFNIDMSDLANEFNKTLNPEATAEQLALQKQVNQFVTDNYRTISFMMIPFFVFGFWLIFKNKGYNFLETAVLCFYGQGHPLWLTMLFLAVYKYSGDSLFVGLLMSISFIYTMVVAAVFYQGNKVWNFIKAFFALIIGFTSMILASAIIGGLLGVILAMAGKIN